MSTWTRATRPSGPSPWASTTATHAPSPSSPRPPRRVRRGAHIPESAQRWRCPCKRSRFVAPHVRTRVCPAAADLFVSLDRYLKRERVKFSELFRKYDRNGEPCAGADARLHRADCCLRSDCRRLTAALVLRWWHRQRRAGPPGAGAAAARLPGQHHHQGGRVILHRNARPRARQRHHRAGVPRRRQGAGARVPVGAAALQSAGGCS